MPAHAHTQSPPSRHPVLTQKLMRKAMEHEVAGRLAEAERSYARCLELDPGHGAASYQLGLIARAGGDPGRAVAHLVTALRAGPDQASVWTALAAALIDGGRLPEARALLERFLRQGFPDALAGALCKPLVKTLYAKALRLYGEDRFAEAESFVDTLILLDDTHADAVNLAGNIAGQMDRPERSIELLTIAIHLDGAKASYFSNLGVAFSNARNEAAAIAAFEKALELDPQNGVIESNLLRSYNDEGRTQDALALARRIVARTPDDIGTLNTVAVVLKQLGRTEEAITAYACILEKDPNAAFARSNLIQAKLYSAIATPEDCFETARAYGRFHADALLRVRPFSNAREPGRRLRLGFVSADLRDHPVSRFLEPFLAHYDRTRFETLAYDCTIRHDAVTESLRLRFDRWQASGKLDDEALADRIEADGIDILVDLAGQTGGHRLLVFARKPAPVQVTWIGLPATTGLSSIDYRLTDAFSEPEGLSEHLHTERLWRIPGMAFCYQPHPSAPEAPVRAPFEREGHVTFGCVNRLEKVSDTVLTVWAAILARRPDARMLFVIQNIEDSRTRAAVEQRFRDVGLPLERIAFEPLSSEGRHSVYERIDLALDPFPFNGVTTSFDGLYMGVPYVTLRGRGSASRMGAAILTALGLPELIAADADAYVDLACRLAEDTSELRRIRTGLRARMAASPLMDHCGHAEAVGAAFAQMWARWCVGDPNEA